MQHHQLHQEKIKYFIVLIGTNFLLTINMCDRGRTITHLQISWFHTQVWYKCPDSQNKDQSRTYNRIIFYTAITHVYIELQA